MAVTHVSRLVLLRRLFVSLSLASFVFAYCFIAVMALSITTIGIYAILLTVPMLLLIWAAPDIKADWDRLGYPLLLVFVTSQIIIPNFYAIPVSGVGWINLRKIINVTMLAYALVVFGLSKEKRLDLKSSIEKNSITAYAMIGFFATIVLSIPFSSSISSSLSELPQVVTTWIAAALVILALKLDFSRSYFIVKWMVINIVPLAAICLLERVLGRRVMFDVMPASVIAELMQNASFQMLYNANSMRAGVFRAVASFSVPLSTGECGAMILPLALYLSLHAKSRLDRSLGWIGLFSTFIILLTTNARGALLASCVVALVFIPIYLAERQRSQPVSLTPSLFICCVPAILALVASTDRFRKTVFGGGATEASNDGRIEQFNLALPHIISRPLFGNGFSMSDTVIGFNTGSGLTVDSGLLSIVVDQGIPGLVLFSMMVLVPVVRSTRLSLSARSTETNERLLYFVGLSLLAFFVNNVVLAQTENFGLLFLELTLYMKLLNEDGPSGALSSMIAPSRGKNATLKVGQYVHTGSVTRI